MKVYQVINQYGHPAHEDHAAVFGTKAQAKDFVKELKEICPKEKFTIQTATLTINK